jgi:insulysin
VPHALPAARRAQFLGNAKYPKEDDYSGFLSDHGGSSNAYTSMEARAGHARWHACLLRGLTAAACAQNTNFYFDVQPNALFGALDRFSQFFISPLFSQSATNREMNAVNSEHVKNLQSDGWRSFQVLQSLARKEQPFHKFGTGSVKVRLAAGLQAPDAVA